MQAVAPAPSRHQAPGELVHDDDLAALHQVVLVALEQVLGAQGLFQKAEQVRLFGGHVFGAVGVAQRLAEQLFHVGGADLGQGHAAVLFADLVIFGFQLAHEYRHLAVPFHVTGGRAGDDQRGAGFVDQDVIHLVHDGVMMAALDFVLQAVDHVVAQVVEAELGVGAVGDIGCVGFHAVHQAHLVLVFVRGLFLRVVQESLLAVLGGSRHLQDADRQAKEMVNGAHPAGITAGQVIVDRHQVDPATGQRVQVERQRGNQGLAFAGAHLGDLALVQDDPADQLHVVGTLPDGAFGSFAHRCEGFRQDFIQHGLLDLPAFLLVLDTFQLSGDQAAELIRFLAQGFVAQGFELRLEGIDLFHHVGGFFDFTFIGVSPEGFHKFLEHGKSLSGKIIA